MRPVQFTGFTDRDFDAYRESKWLSNVFNRERLEVKQKLLALGRLLAPSMQAGDGSLLDCEASAEHPAVWNKGRVPNQYLFFSRNESTRRELDGIISRKRSMAALIEDPSPLRNHIFLSVMIDQSQVELALKLHSDAAVDRENLQRKCHEYFQREKLGRMIATLPTGYRVAIEGQIEHQAADVGDELLQRLIQELPGAASWFAVRMPVPRGSPELGEASFVEQAREQLVKRLLPIMTFIAWSRDNDFVSMRETLRKKDVEQKARGLVKHDQVRVVRGMFSGRTGVVQEIDAKGAVKVQLGTVAVKLAGSDLVKL
jgi:transcription antitermination factor NusG